MGCRRRDAVFWRCPAQTHCLSLLVRRAEPARSQRSPCIAVQTVTRGTLWLAGAGRGGAGRVASWSTLRLYCAVLRALPAPATAPACPSPALRASLRHASAVTPHDSVIGTASEPTQQRGPLTGSMAGGCGAPPRPRRQEPTPARLPGVVGVRWTRGATWNCSGEVARPINLPLTC